MDKSTISMAIFNSYFDITRGTKNACEIPSIQGKNAVSHLLLLLTWAMKVVNLMNHWPVIQPVIHRHAMPNHCGNETCLHP